MAEIVSLVQAKELQPPPTGEVFRQKLLNQLGRSSLKNLTLICAPAGYGKTMLLRQLEGRARQLREVTAWLVLDERHRNDVYLEGCISGLLAPDESRASNGPTILFIDNLERLRGSEGERMLFRLAENSLRGVRLVVSSRHMPKVGATRLRIHGQLEVIGSAELQFSLEEFELLSQESGHSAPSSQLAALHNAGFGWPVALQIATSAISEDNADVEVLANGGVAELPLLRAYVEEELVAPLTADLKSFLFGVAPLVRVCEELAAHVTGIAKAGDLLRQLEIEGLISRERPADGSDAAWFRLHPVIGGCLTAIADQKNGPNAIHRAALEWHIANGFLSDAIRHAFAAGDTRTAADLLEKASRERRRLGRASTDPGWTSELEGHDFKKHPNLHVEAACSFAARFEVEAARTHASNARLDFENLEPVIRDDLYAVDAMMAIYGDHPETCVDVAERGIRDCKGSDPYTLGTLQLIAAIGWTGRSDLGKARRLSLDAMSDNHRAGSKFGIAIAHTVLGLTHAVSGELSEAAENWRFGEATMADDTNDADSIKIAVGYLPSLHYEWNELSKADGYVQRCIGGSPGVILPDMLLSTILTESRLAIARGDEKGAAKALVKGDRIAAANGWPRFIDALEWERVRIAVFSEDYSEARHLKRRLNKEARFVEAPGFMTYATETEANLIGELRYETAVEASPAIVSRLRPAINKALAKNRRLRAAKLLTLEAICRDALGDRTAALRTMRQALEIGSRGRLVRTFLDEGPRALALIQALRKDGDKSAADIDRSYLDLLSPSASLSPPRLEGQGDQIERLSSRELEILRFIFDGNSNADVASKALVSENTVKWHLQNVYSKLDVKNRTGAVAAARRLGLFEETKVV